MKRDRHILEELNEISPLLAGVNHQPVQTIPEGYFQQLEAAVISRIPGEGNSTSIPDSTIPEGYFDSLSYHILSRIEGTAAHELKSISPFLAAIPKHTPHNIPDGYFLGLESAVIEQLPEPALSVPVPTQMTMEVPDHYFEQLPEKIMQRIQPAPATRVILMRLVGVAVAAVFTGLIALAGYFWLQQRSTGIPPIAMQEPLPAFIQEGKKLNEQQFDEKLSQLPEDAIVGYLEKTGAESDMAVLTESIEQELLPDQETYFTNENTLNQFIETLSNNN